MTRLRIAVLMGGPSPERDVSMATGQEIVAALDPRQYDILPVEITKEGHWLPRPDLTPLTDGRRASGRSPIWSRDAPYFELRAAQAASATIGLWQLPATGRRKKPRRTPPSRVAFGSC